jgi:hypothetical protein
LKAIDAIIKIQNMVTGTEAKYITKYIQDNPGTTKDKVAKYLLKENICSRLTTLKMINNLLDIGILKDQRKGKYFHSLYYNKDYDFTGLGLILLNGSLNELQAAYKVLSKDQKFNETFNKLRSVMDETMRSSSPSSIEELSKGLGKLIEKW